MSLDRKERIEEALGRHLRGVGDSTAAGLAERLRSLSADRALTMIETAASLTGSSLRAAVEFLRAAPEVARIADQSEVRCWGDIGKRLASSSPEAAIEFFQMSSSSLSALSVSHRARVLTLCGKQSVLSASIALETFRQAPHLTERIDRTASRLVDADTVLAICCEVARHSVKHSSDLLQGALAVIAHLRELDPTEALLEQAFSLALGFAHRSGGAAADFLDSIAEALPVPGVPGYARLLEFTERFLQRGGGVALQYFRAAASLLQTAGDAALDRWTRLAENVASHGTAASYHFIKASPEVIASLASIESVRRGSNLVARVLDTVNEIGGVSIQAAMECFKASPVALRTSSVTQFREWAMRGLDLFSVDQRKAQAYYALQSRSSQDALQQLNGGLSLETIGHTLRLYVEGLTGKVFTLAPLSIIPEEAKIGDESTLSLPSVVAEFESDEANFKLYKALAAHAAGQFEFGTYVKGTREMLAAQEMIRRRFGLLNAPGNDGKEEGAGYRALLKLFPHPTLASRIFVTLENGRIDRRLRQTYRGLRRDLDFVQQRLLALRPPIHAIPPQYVFHELLFQASLCGGTTEPARAMYGVLASKIEPVFAEHLTSPDSSVADTMIATLKLYDLVTAASEDDAAQDSEMQQENEQGESEGENNTAEMKNGAAQSHEVRADPFSHWGVEETEGAPEDQELLATMAEMAESAEQGLEAGDEAFYYDEWDRDLGDYRPRWCRIIQRHGSKGSRSFVEKTRQRYSGIISSIRHQFQLLRQENLRRISGELDGEDFNLEAVIEYVLDRRTTGKISERLYTRKLRRERDVAVAFLLDMSSSTARTIGRHPKQPYTKLGQRIIDTEKEGLVLLSEALEAVGDEYAMYGFTSEGRRNVKFYVMKDFEELCSFDVERRIGGISYQNNTRLGTAIRHASQRLARRDARTKLLVVLSDGRPYDHDYGDTRYAREDTKMALRQARIDGITPFCITIDREGEDHLRDMYGEVGYTIIDNVLSLPERLPGIYRRLTT